MNTFAQAMERLVAADPKGLIIKVQPNRGVVGDIRNFLEDNRIDYVQATFQGYNRNDLARRLFHSLKNANDRVIIITNSSDIFDDVCCINMLKACLEPGQAPVVWARVGQQDYFEFTGRIIIEGVANGLESRCNVIEV
jgi:hypothetical protein